MKAILLCVALSVLVAVAGGVSFIPAMDIMVYGSDGSLMTIWGEHNFYQDTTSFGHPVAYSNGSFVIGDFYGRNT